MRNRRLKTRTIQWMLGAASFLAGCGKLPLDAELVERFNRRRGHFEAIVAMLNEDPEVGVIFLHDREAKGLWGCGLQKKRLDAYRELMQKTGVRRLYHEPEKGRIVLLVRELRDPLDTKCVGKGFAHLQEALDKTEDNLDCEGPYETCRYRHIEGPWYLYHCKFIY